MESSVKLNAITASHITRSTRQDTSSHQCLLTPPYEHSKSRPSFMHAYHDDRLRDSRPDGTYRQVRVIARAVAVVGPLHEEDGVAGGGLGMDGKGP